MEKLDQLKKLCIGTSTNVTRSHSEEEPFDLPHLPVGSGGVSPALQGPGCWRSQGVWDDKGHGGGGVGLGDGDLLGLGHLLTAVRAEAVALQHGGACMVEAVRDAGVRLALHEGPLGHKSMVKQGSD